MSNLVNWPVDSPQEVPEKVSKPKLVTKHCRACFRDEHHLILPIYPFLLGFLTVITFGLIFVIRPSRCVCCGKMRIG